MSVPGDMRPRAAIFKKRSPTALASFEQALKWLAFVLGLCSTLCVVQGWQVPAMLLSLPFCLIWIFVGWLRCERQLQWINVVFAVFYAYGIGRHMFTGA